MSLLPIFVNLEGRRCLLVGAGTVALEKVTTLLKTGVWLRVVAPQARAEMRTLAIEERIEWIEKPFEPADLDGHDLVIAATDFPEVNDAVYRAALERGILCNSVDDIPNCDFFFGSLVSRGDLQIAISTAGESPAVAQRLRKEIDAALPDDLGEWLSDLGELRREVLANHPRSEERKALLHQLAQRQLCASETCPSRVMAQAACRAASADLASSTHAGARSTEATVALVGAGPGDPELLTLRAVRRIETADVVLHDDLVPDAILRVASRAQIVNVGKRCGAPAAPWCDSRAATR